MNDRIPALLEPILARHGLRLQFGPEVEAECTALAAAPGVDDSTLADLTGLPFVTIDNPDSMDLDQALCIEQRVDGYRVRYALADTTWFVRPGSALFAEALRRGASYYLPGLCVPMLPRALSEDLVSLSPQVDRRALVFDMRLEPDGQAQATALVRARIRSRAKLTYAGVQAHYDQPERSPLGGQAYTPSLELLAEVGRLRLQDSQARDVVQYNRADLDVESDGDRLRLISRPRSAASLYNEQISLVCNMEGARLLAERRGPETQPIYRVHEAPSPQSLERFERIAASLVQAHRLDPQVWNWRRGGESLAGYLQRLPADSELAPVREAIERQALLVNQRSVYSAEPGLHYALGVTPYSRFSSPMREMVGVFTHKEALEALGLIPAPATSEQDEELRERVIGSANQAKELQHRITKAAIGLAIDTLLAADLKQPADRRPARPGTVMGLSASRVYVRLDDPPVDLKIYLDDLQQRLGQRFELQPGEVELASADGWRLRIGDRLALSTAARDQRRGRWHFIPAALLNRP